MPAVSLIDVAPTFITPEEHRERTAATPASFSDIPSVLLHREENVQIVLDPPAPELREEDLKKGTIYIIESVLAFISSTSGRGFQVEYPSITLHAISRDDAGPCIYCQLDEKPLEDGTAGGTDADTEDDTDMLELKLIPQESSSLDAIFEALSQAAALHPDPASGSDLDDDMGLEGTDEAFVDADVEAIQALVAEGVDAEPELSEAGRVRSDFVNDTRFKPY